MGQSTPSFLSGTYFSQPLPRRGRKKGKGGGEGRGSHGRQITATFPYHAPALLFWRKERREKKRERGRKQGCEAAAIPEFRLLVYLPFFPKGEKKGGRRAGGKGKRREINKKGNAFARKDLTICPPFRALKRGRKEGRGGKKKGKKKVGGAETSAKSSPSSPYSFFCFFLLGGGRKGPPPMAAQSWNASLKLDFIDNLEEEKEWGGRRGGGGEGEKPAVIDRFLCPGSSCPSQLDPAFSA